MPVPKNQDPAVTLAKLQLRQTQVKVNTSKKELTETLKKHPHLWIKLNDDVKNLGYSVDGSLVNGSLS